MKLLNTIASGTLDERLRTLYGTADHTRAERIAAAFAARFPAHADEAALFSAPGRTEIGGNHTDHQHGRVLCGSVDLDMLACAAPNGENVIRIAASPRASLRSAATFRALTPMCTPPFSRARGSRPRRPSRCSSA